MNFSKVLIKIIFLILNTKNLKAIETDVFVQSTVNRASQILSKNISKEEKIDQLEIIAKETVDIDGIGMYTLGKYRKMISAEEKLKYQKLFRSYSCKRF